MRITWEGNIEWKQIGHNQVLKGDGFFITYLPNTKFEEKEAMTLAGALLGVETADIETALVTPKEGTLSGNLYRILNGDFRKEYEEAFPKGLDACIAVYESHKAARSDWSTDDAETIATSE